ncbi:hypothetical protein SAMN04488524_2781 [Pedobacter africanus]|uniref:Uncharacterized protein n=2 Tax=Pedobacter africanus TaxID=151894 RepID=A0A1W2BZI1_9SPHI|nr:hypothetical protein SAMN04488524_2781 [Pedobacter africanus]
MLAAVILLLLAFVYGYLSLRQYTSYRHRIHADAALIIKVDADRLYRTLAADYLLNSSHYKGSKRPKRKTGLDIPANVFIYTVYSRSVQTYFCSLPVADTAELRVFLKKTLGITRFKNTGKYILGSSANGRLTVAFNDQTFAAAYSLKKENVQEILEELINGGNFLPETDPRIKKLKALTAHLAYVFEEYTGTGQFKAGHFHMQGDFNFKGLQVQGKVFTHRVFDKDAVLKLWLDAKPVVSQQLAPVQVKTHTIYPDSLLKYSNGYFDAELSKPVNHADTLITYEYNDNFEKVAVTRPRIVRVPGINSMLSARPTGLMHQLVSQGILNGAKVDPQLFPLYPVYTKHRPSAFLLSTNENAAFSGLKIQTPYFFYLEADFSKIREQEQFPLVETYIKTFGKLEVKALNVKPGLQHFEMDLYFRLKQVNALGQLF